MSRRKEFEAMNHKQLEDLLDRASKGEVEMDDEDIFLAEDILIEKTDKLYKTADKIRSIGQVAYRLFIVISLIVLLSRC